MEIWADFRIDWTVRQFGAEKTTIEVRGIEALAAVRGPGPGQPIDVPVGSERVGTALRSR
ncbi:MAG TPA: hypothetical protein VGK19_25650 [Capsulimonadaceae bacterium]